MIIQQLWTASRLRNFNYLIACSETGEALAIDPLDAQQCLNYAKQQGWHITQILNTHEHHDHIGGNQQLLSATGAKLLAHAHAKGKIPGINRGLLAGDIISVGKSVELTVLDTPGHTLCHVCLFAEGSAPTLFCGDTLFNAGAGNCHNGGHPEVLYHTFVEQLVNLPEETKIYPGHDYIETNLKFTLNREPDNIRAKTLLTEIPEAQDYSDFITTLALEKQINSFFRLKNPQIIAKLREEFPDLPEHPDAKLVFIKLRELRNRW